MDTLDHLLEVALTGAGIVVLLILAGWYVRDYVRQHGLFVFVLMFVLAGFVLFLFAAPTLFRR